MRVVFVALTAVVNLPSQRLSCCSRESGGKVELHFMARRAIGIFKPSFKSMNFLRGRIASTKQLPKSALRMTAVGKLSHTINSTVTRTVNFNSNFTVPTMGIGLLLASQVSGSGLCQIYLSFSSGS